MFSTDRKSNFAFFLFALLVALTDSSFVHKSQFGCDLNDISPLKINYCEWNETGQIYDGTESQNYVKVGANCFFHGQNTTVLIIKKCDIHGWHDTDTFNAVPPSRNNIVYSHGRRVKRFFWFILAAVAVVGISNLFANQFSARDRSPPVLNCPEVVPKLADPIQTNTVMAWEEPIAIDDPDKEIRPHRSGPGPGFLFSEGTTIVRYFARDRAGNSNTCEVKIHVKVVRCSLMTSITDGYFMCHPSTDMVQGTTCTFGCYKGHKLNGYSLITCEGHIDNRNGKWSAPQPKCERLQCPRLKPGLAPLNVQCTDTNYYRSICHFSCNPGYDITPGQTRVMLCTEYGSWRGSVPTCRDSEPPAFKNCLGYQIGFVDRGSETARMRNFQIPAVTDNVSKNIKPMLTSKTNPTERLGVGVYDISYSAEDDAGNKAIDCKIALVIKMITCPTIYPTMDTSVACTTGSRYGSNCDFSCESSATLNGTQSVSCERNKLEAYGYWTWGEQQPFCQGSPDNSWNTVGSYSYTYTQGYLRCWLNYPDAKRCTEQLRTPDNGALACDYWLGGKFCQMFCRQHYDIPVGVSVGENMFVCGESGKWMPSSVIPNCARVVGSKTITYRLDIEFHFSGDCHDPNVVWEMQQKFIDHWKSTGFKEGCLHDVDKCTPANIQIRCGGVSGKRSASLFVNFDVQIEASSDLYGELFKNMTFEQYATLQGLSEAIYNGSFNIALDGNTTMYARDLTYTLLKLVCKEGTVATTTQDACAKCVPGTFHDKATESCLECERGTYQEHEGQSSCVRCPTGETTRNKGASHENSCEKACSPGSWSSDGTPPCSYCLKGSFQQSYGGMNCNTCPGVSTTELDGSTKVEDCLEFDIHINSFISSTQRSFKVPSASISVSVWLKVNEFRTENSILHIQAAGNHSMKLYIENKSFYLQHNGNILLRGANSFSAKWYFVAIILSPSETMLTIDDVNFTHNYSTLNFPANGNITIGDGFIGKVSQLNVFTGNTLLLPVQKCFKNKVGDIISWKEFEDILAPNIFIHVPSECDDVNECDSNPCRNGNCTDELHSYSCQCFYGFYGNQCEFNIDDCGDNACDNNGTCIDGPASYECTCAHDYTGKLCEIKLVDGDWTDWGNWSSCSVSCGFGTMSRTRLCTNPTPDNGGSGCVGNDTEIDVCINAHCPVCPKLLETENSILLCDNDTTTDTVNCTLTCKLGHAFDHDPKDFYFCGPDTLHQWDFQTQDNPIARLPSCTEFKNASSLKISYSAKYADLVCGYSTKASSAEKEIKLVLESISGNINCIRYGMCAISKLEVINCSEVPREKRDLSFEKAGITIEFECDAKRFGSEECHDLLLNAFEFIVNQTLVKRLDSEVENQIYPIDQQSLSVESLVSCDEGSVPVDFRCVQCSTGRFELNGNCVVCSIGTYQHKTGQTSCNKCPDNKNTLGLGSTSIRDCSVEKDTLLKDSISGVVIGLISATCVVTLVTIGFILRRYLKKSPKIVDYEFNKIKKIGCSSKPVFDIFELKAIKEKMSP